MKNSPRPALVGDLSRPRPAGDARSRVLARLALDGELLLGADGVYSLMMISRNVVVWISGRTTAARGTLADELRAHLARRDVGAEVIDACGDAEKGAIVRRCEVSAQHRLMAIVTGGDLQRATSVELQRSIGPTVNICILHTAGMEPGAATYKDSAIPDLAVDIGVEPVAVVIDRILALLEERGLIPVIDADLRRDEEMLIERLRDLGYL